MYTESGASVISITTNIDDLKADFIIFPYVERKAFSSEIHFHSYFQCQCILLGAIDCVSNNRKLLAYQGDIFFIAIPDAFRTDLFPTVQNLHRSKVLLPPTQ